MSGLWSILQFANAQALFFALAAPLLVLAYLRRRKKSAQLVSSVLIFKTLSKRPIIKRKFKPPFRFFLEFLALLLLCVAAASPVIDEKASRIAIVLDNSLSMRAASTSIAGANRFSLATDAIRSWLDSAARDNQYSLFLSSPSLSLVGLPLRSKAELITKLSEQKPSMVSDSLPSAIVELSQSADYDAIVVFTDKEPNYSERFPAVLTLRQNGLSSKTLIQGVRIGTPEDNYYVAGIRINSDGINRGEKSVLVNIGYSGLSSPSIRARLVALDSRESTKEIATKSLKLSSGRLQELEFLAPLSKRRAVYKIELLPPIGADKNFRNAILEDDTASVSEQATGRTSVLLVTPPLKDSRTKSAANALGLAQIPGLNVETKTPNEFTRLTEKQLEKHSVIIFHQSAPTTAPKQPTLLILPPTKNPLFSISEEVTQPRIASWNSEHPITAYLRVRLLNASRALVFDPPAWATSVINAEPGPIVAAGEQHGRRVAAVGIELLPFEGKDTPTASVLMLNILNWLSGTSELSESSFFPLESSTFITAELSIPSEQIHHNQKQKEENEFWRILIYIAIALLFAEFFLRYFEKGKIIE